jgi:hypothetical protein
MNENTRLYELLATDLSPVALLVLSGDGATVRHANQTMALLLDAPRESLVGHRLAQIAPAVDAVLRPLALAVAERGRPRRAPGITLPVPDRIRREQTWDAACAPLPPNNSLTPPDLVALWLWPEDTGATASRRVVEALSEAQREALPPVLPGFDIAAALIPSESGAALGGDTFDVIALEEGRWAVLMADVSGRGPAAAARAVMVRHSTRVLVAQRGPGETLSCLSRLLLADPSFAGFVTAFLGVLDTAAGTLTYVVAGHEPTLLLRGQTGDLEELTGDGDVPLAVDEKTEYEARTTPVGTRDILLLYTDGLTDTRRDEEFFDEERLRAALQRHRGLPAPALVATLLAEAEEWAGPNSLRDDTALLVVRGQRSG